MSSPVIPCKFSRSPEPTLISDMSNLAIVSAASKSTTSTAASGQEISTTPNSQEAVSESPSPPEDAQAQAKVPTKPEQSGSDESTEDTPMAETEESSPNTTMSESEESGSDHSSDDEIPHDGGSDLWQAIRLKKDEIERYEAMIEEELEGDESGKERRLLGLRAKLAQQIEARDVFLRKQAEVDRQGRNARWG